MKAAEFDYARAADLDDVFRLLDGAHGEAKIIAGGQTLVPLLVMRLARPTLVVDINGIAELSGIVADETGVTFGAATRQIDALEAAGVARHAPLLKKALALVGHPQTRNRGTIGGSLANADPAAEIGLIARTLDAEIEARSSAGTRQIAAAAFFTGAMSTVLSSEECLTKVRFPGWPGKIGTGFEEMSNRRSDFALVAVACQVAIDKGGVCTRVALGIGGVEPVPVRASDAEKRLIGTRLTAVDIDAALNTLAESLDPLSDVHASADYRRRVAVHLAARTIASARDELRA